MSDANPSPGPAGSEPGGSLLRLVQEGSKQAWDRLVGLCVPLVYTWCRQAGLPEAEATDVGEGIFRTVAGRVADFRPGRDGAFRNWLGVIARRAIADHRSRLTPADGQAETRVQDSEQARDREEAALLYRRAVELIRGEFPEDVWGAFWAVDVEGRPAAEAARTLGLTAKAVHLARVRVRHRLYSEFVDLLGP
jgi:RNA polymerase sigma-70 factor, ECF subfamily